MLAELPADLLDELRHAALVLDRPALTVLIARTEARAPATAKGLRMLVDGLHLGQIRDLLSNVP